MPRDGNGKNDGQATPWPRGLLVEAPPAPKPWRGRTWSNDTISWRTTFTYSSNLSVDDSSSIESTVDWPVGGAAAAAGAAAGGAGAGGGRGGGDDQVGGDGRGAGSGVRFGVAGADGIANGNGNADANANAINTVEKSSSAVISGGGAASSNGASGGRSVGDGGCNSSNSGNSNSGAARVQSGGRGEGIQDDGSRTQRRDGVNSRSGGGGGVVGSGGDNWGAGARGGEAAAVVRRVLPPLAPVPWAGAFQQQHRQAQSSGRNVVDFRAVAFTPTPPQASTPNPHLENAAAAAAGKMLPTLPQAGGQIQTDLGGTTAGGVGVAPLGEVGELGGGLGGTAAPRLGEPNLEGDRGAVSNGAAGTGAGNSAAAVGHEGGTADAAGQNATDVTQNAPAGVDGAAAAEATVAVIGEEAEGSGERVPSMDGLLIGTRCGATAGAGAGAGAGAEGEDVEVMKHMMSCAPVQTYPTRAAIRQWRHMFLP